MQFLNGSKQDIDTIFPDNFRFFELLAMLVDEEPLDSFSPFERFQMQAIGIEKGKPFTPDDKTKALLDEAGAPGWCNATRKRIRGRPGGHLLLPLVASGKASPAPCLGISSWTAFPRSMCRTMFTTWHSAIRPPWSRRTSAKARNICGPSETPSETFWTARKTTGFTSLPISQPGTSGPSSFMTR